jgi:hypothetical protein
VHCWYDRHTDTIRFTNKSARAKRDDWPRCGGHCKSTGKTCRAHALKNGRCKYHGGLSTGPKSPEGKARALENLKQFRRPHYLRQISTGNVYVYTEILAQRQDMEPCNELAP